MHSPEYNAWITSPEWREKADGFRKAYRYRCAICGWQWQRMKRLLDVHHLRYWDDAGLSLLGREEMQDVRCLCRKHHKKGMYPLAAIRRRRMLWLLGQLLLWCSPPYWLNLAANKK